MENNNKLLVAFGLGALTGVVLGILFAPAKGTETRANIRNAGIKLSDNIKEQLQRGKDKLEMKKEALKDKLDAGVDRMRELV